MPKKNNCENNAYVECTQNGKYYNLRLKFNIDGNEEINLVVTPLTKSKKQLAKLMYKIYMGLQ